jgi:hypothetical protein
VVNNDHKDELLRVPGTGEGRCPTGLLGLGTVPKLALITLPPALLGARRGLRASRASAADAAANHWSSLEHVSVVCDRKQPRIIRNDGSAHAPRKQRREGRSRQGEQFDARPAVKATLAACRGGACAAVSGRKDACSR